MDQKQLTPEQVREKIKDLVKEIQNYDGSSGSAERAWREDQQYLLYLLSQYPLEVHQLHKDVQEQASQIVQNYLTWSFQGYW